ncbi:alpha/beta fold hydrolase [Streptomyces sp. NBC_01716]|uniref:alpha/beta fold hydrolase n=1 Tax=Streptomyces sp. NBC_01716 TaxID=2975917 RepID=UPI002E2EBCA4|nr:alpha/beta fold hydrolase [Streptomyces sp. NBC_01716]
MTTRATPLLLLHTWGGSAATWGPALGHLGAGGRHLKALDQPGHGARASEPFTVDGAVEGASAYADGAGSVDVVGSGLGALVALALAQRHPDRVRSLTLVGFPPAGGAEAARRPAHTRAGPLTVPCRILRGARDHRVSAASADALAERLGGAGAVVPGAGHVACLDKPEAFATVPAAFHDGLRTAPAD